jgi:hypothetical protein
LAAELSDHETQILTEGIKQGEGARAAAPMGSRRLEGGVSDCSSSSGRESKCCNMMDWTWNNDDVTLWSLNSVYMDWQNVKGTYTVCTDTWRESSDSWVGCGADDSFWPSSDSFWSSSGADNQEDIIHVNNFFTCNACWGGEVGDRETSGSVVFDYLTGDYSPSGFRTWTAACDCTETLPTSISKLECTHKPVDRDGLPNTIVAVIVIAVVLMIVAAYFLFCRKKSSAGQAGAHYSQMPGQQPAALQAGGYQPPTRVPNPLMHMPAPAGGVMMAPVGGVAMQPSSTTTAAPAPMYGGGAPAPMYSGVATGVPLGSGDV